MVGVLGVTVVIGVIVSSYLLSAFYVPGTVVNTFYAYCHHSSLAPCKLGVRGYLLPLSMDKATKT